MNKKGFTLIELLIVVAIIGILAAVAIPGFLGVQKRSKSRATVSNGVNLTKDAVQYITARYELDPNERFADTDGNGTLDNLSLYPDALTVMTTVLGAHPNYRDANNPYDGAARAFVPNAAANAGETGVSAVPGGTTRLVVINSIVEDDTGAAVEAYNQIVGAE